MCDDGVHGKSLYHDPNFALIIQLFFFLNSKNF